MNSRVMKFVSLESATKLQARYVDCSKISRQQIFLPIGAPNKA